MRISKRVCAPLISCVWFNSPVSCYSMTTQTNEPGTSLEASLITFYLEDTTWNAVLPFLDPERHASISLRLLDYFVVTYAKTHEVWYTIVAPDGQETPFYVNSQYATQLKRYTKSRFDPFCRGAKKDFRGCQTNLKQLNFFRWAITHHVIDYAVAHLPEIAAAHKADLAATRDAPRHKRRRGVQPGVRVRCFVFGPGHHITLEFETAERMKTF